MCMQAYFNHENISTRKYNIQIQNTHYKDTHAYLCLQTQLTTKHTSPHTHRTHKVKNTPFICRKAIRIEFDAWYDDPESKARRGRPKMKRPREDTNPKATTEEVPPAQKVYDASLKAAINNIATKVDTVCALHLLFVCAFYGCIILILCRDY